MADDPKQRARNTSASRKTTASTTRAASAKRNTSDNEDRGAPTAVTTSSQLDPDWLADVQGLSFQEARTALELAMAQLQGGALEVEEMAGLYRRAEAYATRCEAVLEQVEQEVIQWDAEDALPTP